MKTSIRQLKEQVRCLTQRVDLETELALQKLANEKLTRTNENLPVTVTDSESTPETTIK